MSVSIVMGSDSDFPIVESAIDVLKKNGIAYDINVISAHRSPDKALAFAQGAVKKGTKIIIAFAGSAAHLAGVIASHTIIPVIGVPVPSSDIKGLDALLSTVQMPSGVPVATMGLGKAGAVNAAILAMQILSLSDSTLQKKLEEHKKELAQKVDAAEKRVKDKCKE
ncbi:MAG: 5-(carboxyamino)imidazole ribonucleotide mutase [Candidatus Ancaeobacter aquaticus]|nr:5-(carboxyamino)imidazole ribonucleotide mutase [Candidatus Ancaeobacter aquaticus]